METIDEATRERLLAEHLASNLQNIPLSAAFANAGFFPGNPFINLSSPEAVHHTFNLLRAPVATLGQTVGLPNPAAVVGHHLGLKPAGVHPNVVHVPNLGMNFPLGVNFAGPAPPYQFVAGVPYGITIGPKASGGNFGPSALGSVVSSRTSGQSPSHTSSSRVVMGTGNQDITHRAAGVSVSHGGVMVNGATQSGTPLVPAQMAISSHVPVNNGSQRTPVQGSAVPQRFKGSASNFVDEFRLGFPAKGLIAVRKRWWGTADARRISDVTGTERIRVVCGRQSDEGVASLESENQENSATGPNLKKARGEKSRDLLALCAKLSQIRKKSAERGRIFSRLKVCRGYGTKKLEHKEVRILEHVFGRCLPKQWSSPPSSGAVAYALQ